MSYFQCSHKLRIIIYLMWLLAVPVFGLAGDEVFFRYAVNVRNTPSSEDGSKSDKESLGENRTSCFYALARLRQEKNSLQILNAWKTDDEDWQESRLSTCWKNGLFWAGLDLAQQSKLPLSKKLSGLASHSSVPPERLINQLLALKTKPLTQTDQDLAAILRFAALYDRACKSKNSKTELKKLIPAAIKLAPQALRFGNAPYPTKQRYSPHQYILVLGEFDQCYFAIISIVPPEQRTADIKKMADHIVYGGSSCSDRGWTLAFETWLDSRTYDDSYDDDLAALYWQSALLENLNVNLQKPEKQIPVNKNIHPKLHRWRTQVRGLMDVLRSRSYLKKPKFLHPFIQEKDDELWQTLVLLSLEVARINADKTLLQHVSKELLVQRERVYDPEKDDGWPNLARDLQYLYLSAHRAAVRVKDENLQQKLIKEMISIAPYTRVKTSDLSSNLNNFDTVPVWVRVVCDKSRDVKLISEIEELMIKLLKNKKEGEEGRKTLGTIWAMNGASQIKAKKILSLCKKRDEQHDVTYGVGFSVGSGCSSLSVTEALTSLRKAGIGGDTLVNFTAFCNGYTDARDDSRKTWTNRLAQKLEYLVESKKENKP